MTDDKIDAEQQPLLNVPSSTKATSDEVYSQADVDKIRHFLGTSYMMAMGVCGVVLTAIGSTLDEIAENCGTTSTAVGTVFIARGAGAIMGAIVSAKLYAPPTKGNNVMMATMVVLTGLLMYIPFLTSVVMLHVVFCGLGFCTAVTDTGCQIMTRKVQGVQAGPWLGANTVVFGVAGALVPIVDIITEDLFTMYATLSTISVITLVTLIALPHPETPEVTKYLPAKLDKGTGKSRAVDKYITEYFVTEMVIGSMVFWFIGGKVLCSSYIEDYVVDSGVIPASQKEWALMIVWSFIAIGRFAGLHDQIRLNRMGMKGIHPLYTSLSIWILMGVVGGAAMYMFQKSSTAFWTGVVLYGFGNGPCVGYCYDLNNRLTEATEKGMSIVMFGLNFGASIVPYAATLIWDDTSMSYHVVPFIMFISMVAPIPSLYLTRPLNNVYLIGKDVDLDSAKKKEESV